MAVVAIVIAVAARPYYMSPSMPYNGGWWFFFPFGFFFIFFIVFAIGRLLFWPWGWGWRRGYWHDYGDSKEILRRRYARGEVTKDQFDQMMRDLEQHQ